MEQIRVNDHVKGVVAQGLTALEAIGSVIGQQAAQSLAESVSNIKSD